MSGQSAMSLLKSLIFVLLTAVVRVVISARDCQGKLSLLGILAGDETRIIKVVFI